MYIHIISPGYSVAGPSVCQSCGLLVAGSLRLTFFPQDHCSGHDAGCSTKAIRKRGGGIKKKCVTIKVTTHVKVCRTQPTLIPLAHPHAGRWQNLSEYLPIPKYLSDYTSPLTWYIPISICYSYVFSHIQSALYVCMYVHRYRRHCTHIDVTVA